MTIEVKESNTPKVICPHCKQVINMDIMPFRDDITKIMEDKCYQCGGTIIVSMLIICDADMRRMLRTLQAIIGMVDKARTWTGESK